MGQKVREEKIRTRAVPSKSSLSTSKSTTTKNKRSDENFRSKLIEKF